MRDSPDQERNGFAVSAREDSSRPPCMTCKNRSGGHMIDGCIGQYESADLEDSLIRDARPTADDQDEGFD